MAEKQGGRRLGQRVVGVVEDIGLFIILLATIVAAGQEIWHMVVIGTVRLADLLLMFIYLEVVAMVASYWNSGQLPVRMPLYIGMVALARYLILDMKAMDGWRILAVAGAVLVLGLAVLVIRYGHVRFPYGVTDQKVIDKK
ncbi:phosphate-starvation-inducible protein PsiE [Thiohalomonas denitrificans]|uniref:phosphate-starvation-inducible protein PsiE n=1 Tax=Thiohalomonas denitrificans TaxID=415747 RepID=UPI0026F05F2E|nr:phosphate-starvation-inducible PsiE family protein [Thiohalomonas denitrificans]